MKALSSILKKATVLIILFISIIIIWSAPYICHSIDTGVAVIRNGKDIGKVKAGDAIYHSFYLINTTFHDNTIGIIIHSCSCQVINYDKSVIHPLGVCRVDMKINVNKSETGIKTKSINIVMKNGKKIGPLYVTYNIE